MPMYYEDNRWLVPYRTGSEVTYDPTLDDGTGPREAYNDNEYIWFRTGSEPDRTWCNLIENRIAVDWYTDVSWSYAKGEFGPLSAVYDSDKWKHVRAVGRMIISPSIYLCLEMRNYRENSTRQYKKLLTGKLLPDSRRFRNAHGFLKTMTSTLVGE